MINVVGLGPGSKDALTLGTLEVLKGESKVYLRTQKHPTVDFLNSIGLSFETFDNKYDSFDSFDEVYEAIAKELVEIHEAQQGDIVYAVPGHPLVAEKSVTILMKLCEEKNIAVKMLPAVSFVDAVMESLKLDPIEGVKIVDAFDMGTVVNDKRVGTIITQVYDKYIASEVKLALLDYYADDTEIYFVRAAGVEGLESIRKIPLYELDRQEDIDYLTSIYIPKALNAAKDFNDLTDVISMLRDVEGCPWDREQTHESLKACLIEECYEVLEAIDKQDDDMLVEELGDVLLQVVFHAQIAKEEGYFNINDVIKGICNKMIDRHPHIFGDAKAETSEKVLDNWDKIKEKEKGFSTYTEQLNHIPSNLPGLMRADKVQAKAAKVGFDWPTVEPAFDKVLEEINEIKNVYKGKNRARIEEEVGDLIFSTVNVARILDIQPEFALNYTIEKFIKRFSYIESVANQKGKKLEEMSLEEMDSLWEEAKIKNF